MRRAAVLLALGLAGCGSGGARVTSTPPPAAHIALNTGQCPQDPNDRRGWHSTPCILLLMKQCAWQPRNPIQATACRVLDEGTKERTPGGR